jgi:hypothetical protein
VKNAVVIVHGISRHQRYETQDAFATGLQTALESETPQDRLLRLGPNAAPKQGSWNVGIEWPLQSDEESLADAPAFALRVQCCAASGGAIADEPLVDVFEGYWSPIDKEQTNPFRVLSWLLKSTFVPLNDARIPGSFSKLAWDVTYTALALALGLAALWVVGTSAVRAYTTFVTYAPFDLRGLLLAAIGAYLLVQVLARLWPIITLRARVSWWSILFLIVLSAAALTLLGLPSRQAHMVAWLTGLHEPRVWLLISALALRYVLSFAKDFLVDTLGDIQIYTTQDENARFYGFRREIIQTVGNVTLRVLKSKESNGAPTYDKIILVGHSLGTTVLMDVIVALHDLVESDGLAVEDWRRIRAFVTFGTALEKTRFFFDVRDPNLSNTVRQYRRDVYGHLFTSDAMALNGPCPLPPVKPSGIFWANYWYFSDVVANAIVSYASQRDPGEDLMQPTVAPEHAICVNAQLPSPRTLWPHSNYLKDPAFWHSDEHLGAVAIVAHG